MSVAADCFEEGMEFDCLQVNTYFCVSSDEMKASLIFEARKPKIRRATLEVQKRDQRQSIASKLAAFLRCKSQIYVFSRSYPSRLLQIYAGIRLACTWHLPHPFQIRADVGIDSRKDGREKVESLARFPVPTSIVFCTF